MTEIAGGITLAQSPLLRATVEGNVNVAWKDLGIMTRTILVDDDLQIDLANDIQTGGMITEGDEENTLRQRSRSKEITRRRRSGDRRDRSRSPGAPVRSRGPLPSQNDAFESTEVTKTGSPAPVKEKPNFANTGRLAAESNTIAVNGSTVVLKYHEPAEARKPPAKDDWRLYVFKGEDLLEMVPLGERSCWLIGREKLVVDFPIEHPSCSKQHAAIQFRYVEKKNEFGDKTGRVRPYLIDLESSNGSMVNGDPVPGGRYIELRDKDVLKFGHSTREYVLMLSQS
ncbi:hypothetical protein ZTR_01176 [Talaromyces verruculosus]|nr:hypothetical protein ZTR_01176 [Talaromyces verruculosus]